MAELTVTEDRLREVDEFAEEVKLSREEVVDEAMRIYLRTKAMERLRTEGCTPQAMKMAKKFLTEDDFMEFVNEEIHLMRKEKMEEERRKQS